MRNKNSILFVQPDYHCSFAYREEFRKLGWKAEIFVSDSYPRTLLFDDNDILTPPTTKLSWGWFRRIINKLYLINFWLQIFYKFEYHVYYGRPPAVGFSDKKLQLRKMFGEDFEFELFLSKLFKIKLVYVPSGCLDYEYKEVYEKHDDGNVCGNCGFYDNCLPQENKNNLRKIKRYFDLTLLCDPVETTEFGAPVLKYKSIDLKKWVPKLDIPEKFKLKKTKNIKILHSEYLTNSNRDSKNKNIKGSPHVHQAVERLRKEGYPVELYHVSNVESKNMKYYQAQADIVVEQLISGWWGSTLVETVALGKPVVCYLRKTWVNNFFQLYPEYKDIPVINANVYSIYDRLKELVESEKLRVEYGKKARKFAEDYFNPEKNTKALIDKLNGL